MHIASTEEAWQTAVVMLVSHTTCAYHRPSGAGRHWGYHRSRIPRIQEDGSDRSLRPLRRRHRLSERERSLPRPGLERTLKGTLIAETRQERHLGE